MHDAPPSHRTRYLCRELPIAAGPPLCKHTRRGTMRGTPTRPSATHSRARSLVLATSSRRLRHSPAALAAGRCSPGTVCSVERTVSSCTPCPPSPPSRGTPATAGSFACRCCACTWPVHQPSTKRIGCAPSAHTDRGRNASPARPPRPPGPAAITGGHSVSN